MTADSRLIGSYTRIMEWLSVSEIAEKEKVSLTAEKIGVQERAIN